MRIENGKKIRSRRGDNVETKVIGFRAEPSVLEMLEKQSKLENMKRSELILRVLTEYCEKYGKE